MWARRLVRIATNGSDHHTKANIAHRHLPEGKASADGLTLDTLLKFTEYHHPIGRHFRARVRR
jgi:hypothetical protein